MKIFLIIQTVIIACLSEPHCSKFHYEEKLLEKMIRTEILIENMKKQINDIETRVTGALAKLNEDTATWKGEIEALHGNSANLIRLQEKAKSEIDKNIKDKVVSPNIAFHAKNVKNGNPAAGDTIVFTDIVLNLGKNYNTDTGLFTVPLGGIYLFTVQLCIYKSQPFDYGLVIDGVYIDKARYRNNNDGASCHKLSTTISVKSGNKVWVKVIYRSGSGRILLQSDTSYWTSFSGVLIHTD